MLLDFRRPIVDVVSGCVVTSGIVEFRTSNPREGTGAPHLRSGFVDWAAPRQSKHAAALVAADHVERWAERGVAVPAYRAPPSAYEIRVTRGDLREAAEGRLDAPPAATSPTRGSPMRRLDSTSRVRCAQTRAAPVPNADDGARTLVDEVFGAALGMARWDAELSVVCSAMLALPGGGDAADESWDVDEPLAWQLARRDALRRLRRRARGGEDAPVAGISASATPPGDSRIDGVLSVNLPTSPTVAQPMTAAMQVVLQALGDASGSFCGVAASAAAAAARRAREVDEGFVTAATELFLSSARAPEGPPRSRCAIAAGRADDADGDGGVESAIRVDSPADVQRQPAVAMRLLAVLCGRRAVLDVLRRVPAHPAEPGAIVATLARALLAVACNERDASLGAVKAAASPHNDEESLLRGRTLCALVVAHAVVDMARAEKRMREIEGNALMSRRLLSGKACD
jgi:hypothetical protein